MYSPYISWIKDVFSKAQVMIDKFHIHPLGRVTCLFF
ncbi:hypothetical protein [Fervidibacillus albus]